MCACILDKGGDPMLRTSWKFPVLQGDGDMRLWGAVACEFVSALSVQWTEQMRTCVARCRGVSTAHMGRVGGATGWEARGARESFA